MRKGRISPKKSTLKDLEGFIDPADTSLNTPVISNYNTLPASYKSGGETDPRTTTAPASTTAVNVLPINTEALLADNAQLQQRQANQVHFQSLLKSGEALGIFKEYVQQDPGTIDYPPTSFLSQNSPGAPNAQFMGDRQSQDFHNELIASELIGGAVGYGVSKGARAINQAEKNRKLSKALSTNLDEAPLNPDLIEGVLPKIKQSKGEFLAPSDNLILDSKKIKTAQDDIAFTQKAEELQSKIPLTRVVDKSNLVVKDGKLFNSVEPYTVMTNSGLSTTTASRNTSHWSYGHVGDPGHGSWKGRSTAIVSDYETLSKKGYALDLDPTDTFFYNSKDMELPEGSLILTRDKKLYDDIIKNTNQKNVKYYPNTTNDEFESIVNSYGKREGDKKGIKTFEDYLEKNWKEGKDVAHYKPASEYEPVGFQGHDYTNGWESIYEGHPKWDPNRKTVGSPFGGGSSKRHSNSPLYTIEKSGNYRLSKYMYDLSPDGSEFKDLLTYPKEIQLAELEKYKALKRRKPGSKSIAELENAMAKNSGFDSYSDFQKSIELKLPDYKKYGGLIPNYRDGGETDPVIAKQDNTSTNVLPMLPYEELKNFNIPDRFKEPVPRSGSEHVLREPLNFGQKASNAFNDAGTQALTLATKMRMPTQEEKDANRAVQRDPRTGEIYQRDFLDVAGSQVGSTAKSAAELAMLEMGAGLAVKGAGSTYKGIKGMVNKMSDKTPSQARNVIDSDMLKKAANENVDLDNMSVDELQKYYNKMDVDEAAQTILDRYPSPDVWLNQSVDWGTAKNFTEEELSKAFSEPWAGVAEEINARTKNYPLQLGQWNFPSKNLESMNKVAMEADRYFAKNFPDLSGQELTKLKNKYIMDQFSSLDEALGAVTEGLRNNISQERFMEGLDSRAYHFTKGADEAIDGVRRTKVSTDNAQFTKSFPDPSRSAEVGGSGIKINFPSEDAINLHKLGEGKSGGRSAFNMNEIIKNDPVLSSYNPLIKKMEAHAANGVNGAEEAAAHYRELFNKRLKELNVNDASQFDITDLGLHQFNAAKVAIKKPFSYNKYGGIIK